MPEVCPFSTSDQQRLYTVLLKDQIVSQIPRPGRRQPTMEVTLLQPLCSATSKQTTWNQRLGSELEQSALRIEGVEVAGRRASCKGREEDELEEAV